MKKLLTLFIMTLCVLTLFATPLCNHISHDNPYEIYCDDNDDYRDPEKAH